MNYMPLGCMPSKMHAHEIFYEDLARQNIIARLFQRQLGFWRRHT